MTTVKGQMACLDFLVLMFTFAVKLYLFRHPSPVYFVHFHQWCQLVGKLCRGRKCSSWTSSFHFSPLCVGTLGAWGSCAHFLVRWIGFRVTEQSGDSRAIVFLIQRITIEVHCGNGMATIPSTQDWAEFTSLPTV